MSMSSSSVLRTPPAPLRLSRSSRATPSPEPRIRVDSPMLTPSPLQRRVLYPDEEEDVDLEENMNLFVSPTLRAQLKHDAQKLDKVRRSSAQLLSPSRPALDASSLTLPTKRAKSTGAPEVRSPRRPSPSPRKMATTSTLNMRHPRPVLALSDLNAPKRRSIEGPLSPGTIGIPSRIAAPCFPATPGHHEPILDHQTRSLRRLSIRDDDDDEEMSPFSHKAGGRIAWNNPEDATWGSPNSPCTRKQASLPRSKAGIFDLPVKPMPPPLPRTLAPRPPMAKEASYATILFGGPAIAPSPPQSPIPATTSLPLVDQSPIRHSPSRRKSTGLIKKYKPRDSGIAFNDDDDTSFPSITGSAFRPRPSLHIDTAHVERGGQSSLVTPAFAVTSQPSWPSGFAEPQDTLDKQVFKSLAAGGGHRASHPDHPMLPRPNTPVKRNPFADANKAQHRLWQSSSKLAVPHTDFAQHLGAPRKSLPFSFHNFAPQASPSFEESPSRQALPSGSSKGYGTLGLGRSVDARSKVHALRRTSSGAFSTSSSSSGSLASTPTRGKGSVSEWGFPKCATPLDASPVRTKSSPLALFKKPRTPFATAEHRTNTSNTCPRVLKVSKSRFFEPMDVTPPVSKDDRSGWFDAEFSVLDTIGSGEFGHVFKVKSKRTMEEFAIKRSKSFQGVSHRQRLREEAEILKHLQASGGHANVLRYYDSWEEDNMLFIQTELCHLGSFDHFLSEFGGLNDSLGEVRVWKILAELCEGLTFIHTAGVLHLDLKPANIFVTATGGLKIGDFGMASFWPRSDAKTDLEKEGDRVYMAQEILQGVYGKAADVFSFGMIMLEAAANIWLPDRDDAWLSFRNEDFSDVELGEFTPELVQLIKWMLKRDPAARPTIEQVRGHRVVRRARQSMETRRLTDGVLDADGQVAVTASPLVGEAEDYLADVLWLTPVMVSGAPAGPCSPSVDMDEGL